MKRLANWLKGNYTPVIAGGILAFAFVRYTLLNFVFPISYGEIAAETVIFTLASIWLLLKELKGQAPKLSSNVATLSLVATTVLGTIASAVNIAALAGAIQLDPTLFGFQMIPFLPLFFVALGSFEPFKKDWLVTLAAFLIIFIPLYPKVPLFDILPGYIVRVRLEDFLVGGSLLVFLVQLLRKRIALRKDVATWGLGAYLIIGLISIVVAIFIIQSVPLQANHVAKAFLHWLRRVEYFSLFFIVASSIKSLRTAKVFAWLFFITLVVITLYGYGQKYMAYPFFPAFSTMNREFSKGWVLYLTENARVLSTFGGHYDLAGYLVIALSLGWSFFFAQTKHWSKVLLGILVSAGVWLMILTASRASFVGYLIGVSIVIFLWTFRKNVVWGVTRWVTIISLSLIIMLFFGDLSERFLHILHLEERVSGIKNMVMRPISSTPADQTLLENNPTAMVTSRSDQPPTPLGGYPDAPPDVNKDQPDLLVEVTKPDGTVEVVKKERTYSQNAIQYDLSAGIRLDATWPRAINAFKASPLFGTSYGTLTKDSVYQFTEAESTDNDYLRALGETGLLGMLAFYGTLLALVVVVFRKLGGIKDSFAYSLASAFIAFTLGLMANAVLLDIFEASKVAYVYWGMAGLTLGTIYVLSDKIKQDYQPLRLTWAIKPALAKVFRFMRSDFFLLTLIVLVSFQLRTYKIDNPIADWHSWRQSDTSAVTRDFDRFSKIDWLYPTYNDLSSIPSGLPNPKGLRYVEFPIYNASAVTLKKIFPELSVEVAGRVTTNLMWSASLIFLFLLARRYLSRRIAYLTAITFAAIPFGIFYGRSILPDPTMVAFALGSQWAMSRFLETKRPLNFVLSLIMATLALLVKPMAVFLLAPIVYFWFVEYRFNLKKWVILALYFGIAAVPLLWWRQWISQYPAGIPASDWLFNGDNIRFKGAFFYWLFADRIGRLILGYWGLVLLAFGIVRNYSGRFRFYPLVLLGCSLTYLAVFATGNVRHDYYQILLIPALALLVGGGLDVLLFSRFTNLNSYLTKVIAVVSFIFMCAFGWYFVKDLFNINNPAIVKAGEAVRELSHDNALVIAPYDGDTAFLYQTKRKGWPIIEGSVDHLVDLGADYYVSVNYDETTKTLIATASGVNNPREYKVLERNDDFVIIQLVPDNKLPRD